MNIIIIVNKDLNEEKINKTALNWNIRSQYIIKAFFQYFNKNYYFNNM
jgi:hypothetical protein